MAYAFEKLGCLRVEWKTSNFNEASKRATLSLGFRVEGVLDSSEPCVLFFSLTPEEGEPNLQWGV